MTNLANDPMPVFTINAKDQLAMDAVEAYRDLCERAGLTDQAAQVQLALEEMGAWRFRNPERLQLPDHQHVPVGGQS